MWKARMRSCSAFGFCLLAGGSRRGRRELRARRTRSPDIRVFTRDLFECSTGQSRLRFAFCRDRFGVAIDFVAQPFGFFVLQLETAKRPAAVELFAFEKDRQSAIPIIALGDFIR